MFFNSFFVALGFGLALLGIVSAEIFWFHKNRLGVDPGPLIKASKGEIWPKPQVKITNNNFFIIRANVFEFKVVGKICPILEEALQRYEQDLKNHEKIRRNARLFFKNESRRRRLINEETFKGHLDYLEVNLMNDCEEMPHLDMDERYELKINDVDALGKAVLQSNSIWGILRGLETWSQLIYFSNDYRALMVNSSSIMDFPRFSHRGLLIDTSRHFLPLRTIYTMLDAMAMNKMNVLHWHIVDDQSFPYQSKKFPELSDKGAYASTHVYSPLDVQHVIEYAIKRGIRIIPEFDSPGHTRSWGESHPELLTECYTDGTPDGSLGPINPIVPNTYDFMKEFLEEVKDIFPDSYIHLGGDEIEHECWRSNPDLQKYMLKTGLNVKKLEELYMKKIIKMANNVSANVIVWQEVFDDGVNLDQHTLVQIWKGNHKKEIKDVTSKGFKVLLSSCWYLDALSSGGNWHEFYRCDPHDGIDDSQLKSLVIGGEACMWGEVVDVNNVLSRVWPRACAAAERLWSSLTNVNIAEASRRLEEHTCRMNRRKIPAQPPNGAGFCSGINYR